MFHFFTHSFIPSFLNKRRDSTREIPYLTNKYNHSLLVTFAFPIALDRIGWKIYMINGAWDILELLFVIFFWIETKGKTLEEIDEVIDGVKHSDMLDLDLLKRGDGIEAAAEVLEGREITSDRVDSVTIDAGRKGPNVNYKEATERTNM